MSNVKNILPHFNANGWFFRLCEMSNTHNVLSDIMNSDLLQEYAKRIEIMEITEEGALIYNDQTFGENRVDIEIYKELIEDNNMRSGKLAYETYSRQILVLCTTYIEIMMFDFFYALFMVDSKNIKEFLDMKDEDKILGYAHISEIVKAGNVDTLLSNIARRCAKVASKGKISTRVNRIKRLTKITFNADLEQRLSELVYKRNKIVHEDDNSIIEDEYISIVFNTCHELLMDLANRAMKNRIDLGGFENVLD